ncbi:hypothetical protein [Brevundimonas sp.]|uniref:hypothetical protein n=1 Tax=Brevundimonas sp. TaxID=1871086 RepID=UPI003D138F39
MIDRIKTMDFQTREEWVKELHRIGAGASTTATALKRAKSDRQLSMRDEARETKELIGQALSFFEYGTWPMPTMPGFKEIAAHIEASIAAGKTQA